MEDQAARKLAQPHREERRRQVAREPLPQGLRRRRAGPRGAPPRPARRRARRSPSPWMWSMCRWVSRTSIRRVLAPSARPRRRMPVPASRTSTLPSAARDLDARRVAAVPRGLRPGAATDPRVPQSRELHGGRSSQKSRDRARGDGLPALRAAGRSPRGAEPRRSRPWITIVRCAGCHFCSATASASSSGGAGLPSAVGRRERRSAHSATPASRRSRRTAAPAAAPPARCSRGGSHPDRRGTPGTARQPRELPHEDEPRRPSVPSPRSSRQAGHRRQAPDGPLSRGRESRAALSIYRAVRIRYLRDVVLEADAGRRCACSLEGRRAVRDFVVSGGENTPDRPISRIERIIGRGASQSASSRSVGNSRSVRPPSSGVSPLRLIQAFGMPCVRAGTMSWK